MVFSSIPVYLDPPNWHQQQNHHHHQTLVSTTENPNLPPLPPPSLPSNLSHVGGPSSGTGTGSVRPGSMADRARMAKIPQPETALKCPRCDSTNTKFCYFNNYSLTQPRHFCKTCRRYWTRGGALRNVPVGGGCRRNKKSKSSTSHSKSPATGSGEISNKQSGSSANPSGGMISPSASNPSNSAELAGHFSQASQSHSSFMASIQNLARFSGTGSGSATGALGLNFSEIQGQSHHHEHGNLGFQIGSAAESGDHQWRLQQFPLMGGHEFEAQAGNNLYPFHQGIEAQSGNMAGMIQSRVSQFNSVKLEGRHGLNLSSRPSLGISENNNQFWGGNGTNSWTDLSGLNSSSTSHLL